MIYHIQTYCTYGYWPDTDLKPQSCKPIITACDKCGKMMVIRDGRYGKFMACPGFPKCKNIKNLPKAPEKAVGKCPDCRKPVYARKSKKGKVFYGCSGYPDCKFMSWGIPLDEKCVECDSYLIKNENKNEFKIKCSNKECKYERIEPKPKTEES